jgi:gamma-glutamylcyclotransferase (GGCT)/AIG2-like uncharacterized protein YtfP
MSDSKLVPVFVYGTLRINGVLHRWIEPAIHFAIPNCTTPGQMHFAALGGQELPYPAVRFNATGEWLVKGDVLYCERGEALDATASMELSSGYRLKVIECTRPDGVKLPAYSFEWEPVEIGQLIPEGEWTEASWQPQS